MTSPQHPVRERSKKRPIAAEIHARVEHALQSRRARGGTPFATIEEQCKRGTGRIWSLMKQSPFIGVVAAGALGLALASTVGVGELVIAIAAGYAAYEVLREGVAPAEAVKEGLGLVEEVVK